MKTLIFPIAFVVLVEAGAALVLLNATPHPPLGFRLWFGSIAALAPIAGYWLYRRLTAKA